MIIKLTKKITYEGHEYEELNLDLESLTGRDLFASEDAARILDGDKFQLWGTRHVIQIAARAAKVTALLFYELSLSHSHLA